MNSGLAGCGGLLTRDQGEFEAPSLEEVYHENMDCEWVIRVPPGERIELNFTKFDLENPHRASGQCIWDYIEVWHITF